MHDWTYASPERFTLLVAEAGWGALADHTGVRYYDAAGEVVARVVYDPAGTIYCVRGV